MNKKTLMNMIKRLYYNINIIIILGYAIYNFYCGLYDVYALLALLFTFALFFIISDYIFNNFKFSPNILLRTFQKILYYMLFF